jgi:hypothetical protein
LTSWVGFLETLWRVLNVAKASDCDPANRLITAKQNIVRNSILLALFGLAVLFTQPGLAAAGDKQIVSGPLALLMTLLYAIPPWVVGLLVDFLIVRTSVVVWKGLATAVLSMVLGYPAILFSLTMLFLPDSLVAWIICSVLLAVALASVKLVAYWVVNEKFPAKKTSLLFFVSGAAMVGAAFLCMMFMQKPPAAP